MQAQQLQTEYALMKEWALFDGLTGIANRCRCEQALREAMARGKRYGGRSPFAYGTLTTLSRSMIPTATKQVITCCAR